MFEEFFRLTQFSAIKDYCSREMLSEKELSDLLKKKKKVSKITIEYVTVVYYL